MFGFYSNLSGALAKPVHACQTPILFFLLQDLAFQSRFSEQVLDVGVLSPVLDSPVCKVSALHVMRDQSLNKQVKILLCGVLSTG